WNGLTQIVGNVSAPVFNVTWPTGGTVSYTYSSDNGATWSDELPTLADTYQVRATTTYADNLTTENIATFTISAPPSAIFVSVNGTGNGTSWATPSADLQAAIDIVAAETPKGTVYLAGGNYEIAAPLDIKGVTIIGSCNPQASGVDYSRTPGNTPWEFANQTTITSTANTLTMANGGVVDGIAFVATTTTSEIPFTQGTVQNCSIKGQGLGVNGTNTTRNLLNSKIFDNTRCGIANFGTTSSGGSGIVNIDSCYFTGITTSAGGLIFFANSALTMNLSNSVVANNIISDGQKYGNHSGAVGVFGSNTIGNVTNCTIINNEIKNAASGGSGVFRHSGSLTVKNSVVWGNFGSTANEQFKGSITVLNTASNQPNFTTTYSDSTNYLLDSENTAATGPNFSEDFSLLAVSPLINRGSNDAASETDILGKTRIWNDGVVDIGAYELQEAAAIEVSYIGIENIVANTHLNHSFEISDNRTEASDWNLHYYTSDDFDVASEISFESISLGQLIGTYYVRAQYKDSNYVASDSKSFSVEVVFTSTRYVTENGAGRKDGSDWQNALAGAAGIQTALSQNGVTEIWIAGGTYASETATNAFTIPSGVKVYGGFSGTENSVDERLITGEIPTRGAKNFTNETILTKGSQANTRIVTMVNGTTDAITTLDGVTVTGGSITGASSSASNISNCGGGVQMDGSDTLLSNCIIVSNISKQCGGGVIAVGGTIFASTIKENAADNTFTIPSNNNYWGADNLHLLNGATIFDSEIIGFGINKGTHDAGGISVAGSGTAVIENCLVTDNSVGRLGGGVYIRGNVEINNSSIVNNQATNQAGGIYLVSGFDLKVDNSIIAGNKSKLGGGFVLMGGANIANSLIAHNEASELGSAISARNNGNDTYLNNCTIVRNYRSGSTLTRPLFDGADSTHNIHLVNSVIWGNEKNGTTGKEFSSTSGSTKNCAIYANEDYLETIDSNNVKISSDSLIFANPSATSGVAGWQDNLDYSLVSNSLLINAGNNLDILPESIDLAGNVRVWNPAGKTDGIVDIGAYEHQNAAERTVSITNTSKVYNGNEQVSTIVDLNTDSRLPVGIWNHDAQINAGSYTNLPITDISGHWITTQNANLTINKAVKNISNVLPIYSSQINVPIVINYGLISPSVANIFGESVVIEAPEATINGNELTFNSEGSFIVKLNSAESPNYFTASEVVTTVVISNNLAVIEKAPSLIGIQLEGDVYQVDNNFELSSNLFASDYSVKLNGQGENLAGLWSWDTNIISKVGSSYSADIVATFTPDDSAISPASYAYNFQIKTYSITVKNANSSLNEAALGEFVTITPILNSGELFDIWEISGFENENLTNPELNITMPANAIVVTAVIKQDLGRRFVTILGAGRKDGTSWNNAYENSEGLQTALKNPAALEIWLAAGVYSASEAMRNDEYLSNAYV
ncbi:MAG: beta strand repeat-containing protein, partial [Lentisphaeria bacterium]